MALMRENLTKLQEPTLFTKIAKETQDIPENLSIDLAFPFFISLSTYTSAFKQAFEEIIEQTSAKKSISCQGYFPLRKAIAEYEYQNTISPNEIFIHSGITNTIYHLLTLLCSNTTVGIQNPCNFFHKTALDLSGVKKYFLPSLEEKRTECNSTKHPVEIILLSSQNSPTGKTCTKQELEAWVNYAKNQNSILIYDASDASFISSNAIHSIYEIPEAKQVAVEVRNLAQKGVGTNFPCSYLVVPEECKYKNRLFSNIWKSSLDQKCFGISYAVQKACLALYSAQGHKKYLLQIQEYRAQAVYLRKGLLEQGFNVFGGVDAPYIWCETPNSMSSWEFFSLLANKAHIITIPGKELGTNAEGFVRLSTLPSIPLLTKALAQIEKDLLCAI